MELARVLGVRILGVGYGNGFSDDDFYRLFSIVRQIAVVRNNDNADLLADNIAQRL
jgi:hypothetical protein